jgi:hypothetical protein
MIIFSFVSCKDTAETSSIKARVNIDLRAVNDARMGMSGAGEFTVSSSESISVKCTNCGAQLDLKFSPSDDSEKIQKSVFQFPYVEKTHLCKLNFQVKFKSGKNPESIDYGLYLCPQGKGNSPECDFDNVFETCRLN